MSDLLRCAVCRWDSMERIGPATEWSTDPPPIDAAEYSLYRCTTVTVIDGKPEPCGAEVKRKADGTATRDPRWAPAPSSTEE